MENIFHDWRQPGHQGASQPTSHQPPIVSPPVPQGERLDDGPLPNSPIRDIVITERDAQLLGDIIEPRRWPFREALYRATPLHGQRALKELSLVIIPGAYSAEIAAVYCWRMFPRSSIEWPNFLLKAPSPMGSRISARSHWKNSGPRTHWATKHGEENDTAADRRAAW